MGSLSYEIASIMDSLGIDGKKYMNAAKAKACYADAVKAVWKDESVVRLILDHTNAFYIRKDDRPRRGAAEGVSFNICEICSDDPLIRSELDTHRELIALELRNLGLRFEELKIIPARRGMRDKHPFEGYQI